ncbi:enoyl-CoA hydratase/isomerase family protein [Nocardia sp. NPDC059239]|uniref:enoyl-CoA hydratase/isomerase family protein n=1 Tax=unclassified Nocardia TaxID=2637762 RepID=UPI00367B2467
MSNIPTSSAPGNDARPAVQVTRPAPGVAMVTLDRPASLNALDGAAVDGLIEAFTELAIADEVTVVVVTGAGRGFCAGADLSTLADGVAAAPPLAIMQYVGKPLRALANLPQVTIAAVDGPAVGAGWGLALACDVRIGGPRARFGATFVRMGLGPDYGLSATLPRAVGRDRALELLTTGRFIEAEEAARLGAVSEVVPDAHARALELAASIAGAPNRTIRSIKQTLVRAESAGIDEVVDVIEANAQARLIEHPHFLADAESWLSRHNGASRPGA